MGDLLADRCADCFSVNRGLWEYEGLATPSSKRVHLCKECLASRRKELAAGKEVRPVGIPADISTAVWVDLPDVTIQVKPQAGGGTIVVKAKFRKPTVVNPGDDDGGEVRYKLPDLDSWLAAGILFLDTPAIRRNMDGYALASVKHSLRQLFEPNAEVL